MLFLGAFDSGVAIFRFRVRLGRLIRFWGCGLTWAFFISKKGNTFDHDTQRFLLDGLGVLSSDSEVVVSSLEDEVLLTSLDSSLSLSVFSSDCSRASSFLKIVVFEYLK